MPETVVIIPNHNGAHHLRECLDSLWAQSYKDFRVIVVDNGSTDQSRDLLKEKYPWVRTIHLDSNLGFSAAVNAGIKGSASEYVVLLNNDTKADAAWLAALVGAMNEVPQAAFGVSKMLFYDRPEIIDAAGDGYSLKIGAGFRIGLGEPISRYCERAWVFGASAAASIYRRPLFADIGLFDEDFFLVFEDVDIDMRAQVAGHRCLYVPDAIVYHKRGATVQIVSPEVQAGALRNRIWVAGRSLPFPLLLLWFGLFIPRVLWAFIVRAILRGWVGSRSSPRQGEASLRNRVGLAELKEYFVPELIRAFRLLPKKRREARSTRKLRTFAMLRAVTTPYRPFAKG